MKLIYNVPELVWNSYSIKGITKENLEALFKKENTRNIWKIQILYPELHLSIDMEEACFDFIDTEDSDSTLEGIKC